MPIKPMALVSRRKKARRHKRRSRGEVTFVGWTPYKTLASDPITSCVGCDAALLRTTGATVVTRGRGEDLTHA